MYELLIVDDEIHIARGISSSVDWSQFGIEKVHVTYNIRQAKEIFLMHSVDIIICDIEMPEGNGFELLSWVKEHYPSSQAILLTCHADFEYAQRAIQLGTLEYILKPVPQHILETVVVKAIESIEKNRERSQFNQIYNQYYELWTTHQPLLVERFWLDLLHEKISSRLETIEERFKTLNIPFGERTRFLPILIRVHRWYKELSTREEQIMEYALRKAAEEMLLIEERKGYVFSVSRGVLLVIISVNGHNLDKRDMKMDCESYISACNKYMYCWLSCYIGECVTVQNVKESFDKLMILDKQNVTAHNRVLLYSETIMQTKSQIPIEQPHMSLWSVLLGQAEKERLHTEITAYLETWLEKEGIDASVVQELYQDFLQMIHYTLKQKGIPTQRIYSEIVLPDRTWSSPRSVLDLEDWMMDIAERAISAIQALDMNQTVADQVKNYIVQNMDKDFSRKDLADNLDLSPDYIVKLFKKETGESISDYIVRVRVDNAKNLLVKTEISICQIALQVGYSNFSYFSKVFKKATDYNPQQFRKIYKVSH